DQTGPPLDRSSRQALTVSRGYTLAEVAAKMTAAGSVSAAVIDADHLPQGLITTVEITSSIANRASVEIPLDTVLSRRFVTAQPGLTAGDYFLKMMKGRVRTLLVTADGSPNSRLEGVITDSELSLLTGYNPAFLLTELLRASTVSDWGYLLQQARPLLSSA